MNRYDGIDKRIVSNVKTYAKNLKRKTIFRSMDTEDLEQELMCEVLSCVEKFDKRCGKFEHFIRKILNRRCATLIETYMRKKRDSIIKFSEYSDDVHGNDFQEFRELSEQRIEASEFINMLPIKFRMLFQLLSRYSIADTVMITGLSRSSICRDIKRMTSLFNHFENSKNHLIFIDKLRRSLMGRNLSTIETLNVKELSQLEIYDLADLNEQVAKLVNHTKEIKEKLEDALNLRFSETVQSKLHDENKDTGTTKFYESGFQIIAEVPKKVTWDSDKIDEIIKTISEEKRKAIIKTTHVIDERKYVQLSPEDKQLFADARTVTPGKTKFKISIPEEV
ncbi:MAG: sigma-70 family RNA polymerase sigma factor [Alphaproteobacteria bacterium]|nr:sigma-70 family RNA polymerase sigma factor [Alphaproteobacteria bacterium]